MARKTLDSNSKRKADEEDVKKVAELSGDELLSSIATKKKKTEPTGSNQKPKPNKKPQDSKNKVMKTDTKVKIEIPVKRAGKKDEAEVKSKVNKIKVNKGEEAAEENENGAADYVFPMNRVTRIVKSENSDVKLSAEAAFLFNKASEKFLELFSKEAYARASKEGKKKIEYHHLSSLIPGNKRFDFLSDFVPAKVKVADALKEIPSVET